MPRLNPSIGSYKGFEEPIIPGKEESPEETEARNARELTAEAVNALGLYSTNAAFKEERVAQNRYNYSSGIMEGVIISKKNSWVSSIGSDTTFKSEVTVKNNAMFRNMVFKLYEDVEDGYLVTIKNGATAMFDGCVFQKLDNQPFSLIHITGSNSRALFNNCMFIAPSASNGTAVIVNANTADDVILTNCLMDCDGRLSGTLTNNGSFLT